MPDRRPFPAALQVARRPAELAGEVAAALGTVRASGLARPVRPDRLARAARATRHLGFGPAASLAAAAALHPERTAVLDDLGSISFAELDRRAGALAGAMRAELGVPAAGRMGVLCRNHRGFIEGAAAAGRLGLDLVPLNTDFAGPQLGDVLRREGVVAVVQDAEFDGVFDASGFEGVRIHAWTDVSSGRSTIDDLVDLGRPAPAPPKEAGHTVALTSGTTGTPKGAHRQLSAVALLPLAAGGILDLARLKPTPRAGEPFAVPPPLFHLFGQIGLLAGFAMGSPLVLRRRFDASELLADIERHQAGVLLAVPTMLGRIMGLPASERAAHDHSSLRFALSGAAPLPPELALAFMDEFGDILFNGYASTEVGTGTLATPADLRAAPGTIGRPMAGVRIRILDDEGRAVPAGGTGRIFVGSPLLFDGYSGGGTKEMIDGLMSSGDVGHYDSAGRLFIDGRDDDMILSGGENVFPQEVEELLSTHPGVADAAVFGVSDPDFGQRLAALVVREPSAPGSAVESDELRELVRARLARFKVPREIQFVARLPRTDTGKIQRRKLPALLSSAGGA